MDKMCFISQKGYSSTNQCQEVLITLIDEIALAKKENKRGAVLSLDIKKAFDSISHKYLKKVYEFYNFGEKFQNWLSLIGTNRRACIILEDESLSTYFNLERGNAQGDTISPYLFNLGYQILLLKLNYDLQIHSLGDELPVPPHLDPLPATVSKVPRKIYAFADDGNCLTKMDIGSLSRIKKILEDFGILSGLECNVEKTGIMQVGSNLPIPLEVRNLGFACCNELTILGLKIQGDSNNFTVSFNKITEKVNKAINHWKRFNLSLPGRINISKCMLYSQINYLGCFLKIPEEILLQLESLIEKFVKGKLNIAKKRLYQPPEQGGLGLFELKPFLCAQKCSWIKRSKDLNEIWKQKIYFKSLGKVSNIRKKFFDKEAEPVIYGMASSFEYFTGKLTTKNENFWKSVILYNPMLPINLREKLPMSIENFSAENRENCRREIGNLVIDDLFIDRGPYKGLDRFRRESGIRVSPEVFEKLRSIASIAKLKFTKRELQEKKSISVAEFLEKREKGSKQYRKIILEGSPSVVPHNIVKFGGSMDVIINLENSKKLNSCWNIQTLTNSTRTFLFKLHNNVLGYNTAVAHFVRGHSDNCTFCDIAENVEPMRETPIHLFYQCETSENLINGIFSHYQSINTVVTRSELFVGFGTGNRWRDEFFFIVSKLVLKYLWDCKVRKSVPLIRIGLEIINREIQTLLKLNKKFRENFERSDINVNLVTPGDP
jgi:hypothetical protein